MCTLFGPRVALITGTFIVVVAIAINMTLWGRGWCYSYTIGIMGAPDRATPVIIAHVNRALIIIVAIFP